MRVDPVACAGVSFPGGETMPYQGPGASVMLGPEKWRPGLTEGPLPAATAAADWPPRGWLDVHGAIRPGTPLREVNGSLPFPHERCWVRPGKVRDVSETLNRLCPLQAIPVQPKS